MFVASSLTRRNVTISLTRRERVSDRSIRDFRCSRRSIFVFILCVFLSVLVELIAVGLNQPAVIFHE